MFVTPFLYNKINQSFSNLLLECVFKTTTDYYLFTASIPSDAVTVKNN